MEDDVLHSGERNASDEVDGIASVEAFTEALTLVDAFQSAEECAVVEVLVAGAGVQLEAPFDGVERVEETLRQYQAESCGSESVQELEDERMVIIFVELFVLILGEYHSVEILESAQQNSCVRHLSQQRSLIPTEEHLGAPIALAHHALFLLLALSQAISNAFIELRLVLSDLLLLQRRRLLILILIVCPVNALLLRHVSGHPGVAEIHRVHQCGHENRAQA